LRDANCVFAKQDIDVTLQKEDLVDAIDFNQNSQLPHFADQVTGNSRRIIAGAAGWTE
jgi:hypothetical protein